MEFPIDDIVKVGSGSASGLGLMAMFARFLRGDLRRIEVAQQKINADIYDKLNTHGVALNDHALKDASDMVHKDEFSALRAHIDAQFAEQRGFFLTLIKDR